ncbi:MAG: hypothetical protein IJN54_10255 [Lachnospiraceae bacterium]|nr:hypothetical protein [Lachnospiraceae bacterium]
MIYNGKATQCESKPDSAYSLSESHNNMNKEVNPEEYPMDSQTFICKSKNQEVKVTVEFPTQSNKVAEQEFITRLKEIYLRKIKIGAMQQKESALSSQFTKDKEENINE